MTRSRPSSTAAAWISRKCSTEARPRRFPGSSPFSRFEHQTNVAPSDLGQGRSSLNWRRGNSISFLRTRPFNSPSLQLPSRPAQQKRPPEGAAPFCFGGLFFVDGLSDRVLDISGSLV